MEKARILPVVKAVEIEVMVAGGLSLATYVVKVIVSVLGLAGMVIVAGAGPLAKLVSVIVWAGGAEASAIFVVIKVWNCVNVWI